ncbi:putative vacuolar protein sorting-associated protein TDA6 [Lachnellula suecica]|uniref:Putative vacuolar protein sorting-associated protein TDA6 n=1 Tax=Lachnellula suecica TaxID=602035 RepID=A0A8T9BVQ2_9HELO|nr:putative vacuolar protein sorting-associated protein TDA6 [Lachnellula suecica]
MFHLRRLTIAVILIVATYIGLSTLKTHLDPNKHKPDERKEDVAWIATSKHWLDRQASRAWSKQRADEDEFVKQLDWEEVTKPMVPGDWEGDGRVLKEVPQFVLDHAPLVHLYSKEEFWPSDIAEHLMHTTPYLNHTNMYINDSQHTVHNLNNLNAGHGPKELYMHSKEDVEERPDWLGSAYNKPIPYPEDDDEEEDVETYTEFTDENSAAFEKEDWFDPYRKPEAKQAPPISESSFKIQNPRNRKKRSPTLPGPGGYSPAPSILVLVDKGNGILDAFWFYFYSYNLGTTVLNIRFGNHIGDWEHSLIRFKDGVPKAVFFSAHSGGLAYSYNAVEKSKRKATRGRPVLYSAIGSHAMYATPGKHPYVLPFGLLADVTDRGPLWDPAQNYLAYHYNTSITHNQDAKSIHLPYPSAAEKNDILQPAACNPTAPMGWWWYQGRWGDKFYELGDLRQWRFFGENHYVNGPFGPSYKNLGRSRPCQSGLTCTILESIEEGKGKSWITGLRRRGVS